ncbi:MULTISPECIES: hypothetical protein [Clostridium]|uniref:hypothetical protein n=1 Tax=Clostridium TaxID=1485 RepID=UPI0004D55D12|nr:MULTISPECIES: hypothetical protein [Clostridium]KEH89921.1 hypothetical protein Z967_04130 [Clostridium novyi A str. 4540]KEH95175.1 hypothetical protein Z963_03670 [Clostridium botulinum C/D str. It1]KEH95560.1 hypothetical protein Z964_05010 [Clostridium novyi A str. GD211209]
MFNPFTFTFNETIYTNLHLKECFTVFICLQLISVYVFYWNKTHKDNKFKKIISKVLYIVSNIIAVFLFIEVGLYTKSLPLRLTGLCMVFFMGTIGKKLSE